MLRLYAVGEVPQYDGIWDVYLGCARFMVDLLSILPWYFEKIFFTNMLPRNRPVRCYPALRLLRMLKAEQYTEAFTVLDDVVRAQSDV